MSECEIPVNFFFQDGRQRPLPFVILKFCVLSMSIIEKNISLAQKTISAVLPTQFGSCQ